MDIDKPIIRGLLFANQFLQRSSSVIVMSLASCFIAWFNVGEHLIYEIVIATINVAFYFPALFLPFWKSYKGYMLPLSIVMSYLWITAFIFEAQDYNWHNCRLNAPKSNGGYCGRKKAMESFTFTSFFFTLTAILLEVWLLSRSVVNGRQGTSIDATTAKNSRETDGITSVP